MPPVSIGLRQLALRAEKKGMKLVASENPA